MSGQFVEAMKAEIADLELQLHADPKYVKVHELKRLMALYVSAHDTPRKRTATPSGSRPFASGAAATILGVVREILVGRTEPTPTQAIMEVLDERGVRVGGSVPRNSVSSILSKSEDFISHGRSGWTLVNGYDAEKAGDESSHGQPSPTLLEPRTDHPGEPRAQGREAGTGGGT